MELKSARMRKQAADAHLAQTKEQSEYNPYAQGTCETEKQKAPTENGWGFDWWRRADSNRRPRVLCQKFYMFSPVYYF